MGYNLFYVYPHIDDTIHNFMKHYKIVEYSDNDSIIKNIDSSICKGNIDNSYIRDNLEQYNKLNNVLLFVKNKTNDTIKSFAIFYIDEEIDNINIPIICSSIKGHGNVILRTILKYANKMQYNVNLRAVNNVVDFYKKYGFKKEDEEDNGKLIDMKRTPKKYKSSKLPSLSSSKKEKIKGGNKSRKIKQRKDKHLSIYRIGG